MTRTEQRRRAWDRRMLLDEQRELRAHLTRPREPWLDVLSYAAERRATRARLGEIAEELSA
jgi:hypothetical protein